MRKVFSVLIVICSVLLLFGVNSSDAGKVVKEFSDVRTIEPDKFYEKCAILKPRQVFSYKFSSTDPMYFNIHYHGNFGRKYFVEMDSVSSLEDKITESKYRKAYKGGEKRASICMLWKNNSDKPIELSLDCVTSKK